MGDLASEWSLYIDQLYDADISLNSVHDHTVWVANKQTGVVRANLAYLEILKSFEDPDFQWWHTTLWKIKIPG